MQYNIHLFERKAVCPKCSGMLVTTDEVLWYRCVDCKGIFKVVDSGITEREAICEQIAGKEDDI